MKLSFKHRLLRFISTTFSSLKTLPHLPRWMVLFMDTCISMFAFTISYLICYELLNAVITMVPFLMKLLFNTSITVFFFLVFKSYAGIIRYSGFMDTLRIFVALLCANILMVAISNFSPLFSDTIVLLNSGFFISFILTFVLMLLFRVVTRVLYDLIKNGNQIAIQGCTPLVILGITPSNVSIAKMIKNDATSSYRVVGFISTNSRDIDKSVLNEPVFSMNKKDTAKMKRQGVKAMLIDPAEVERREKQEIAKYCMDNKIQILSPPPVSEWINGQPNIGKIKSIQIEDLLGRVPIKISVEEIAKSLGQTCVMVTGAAGSIGSEIVRQVAQFNPKLLLLCDNAETPLHHLQLELEEKFPELNFLPVVCDVRNYDRMEQIFKTCRPSYIYHAAAYKHVPLMEKHPSEAVYTNAIGSKNVVDLAIKYEAEVFVMVSTDKAVNPTNVMGTSKRIAEIYVQSLFKYLKNNQHTKTKIITTRFGNVLGSNGSVIPLFKNQIANGGPVTVTHPDITRYFMTIREACRLVLEAGNMGKGGEIFVFDMGSPVKIIDLAEKMIHLAGFAPYKDIDIKITGLRQGEKLFEELLANEESTQPTHNAKILIGSAREYDYLIVNEQFEKLLSYVLDYKDEEVVKIMKELVPEFISVNSPYEVLDKEK